MSAFLQLNYFGLKDGLWILRGRLAIPDGIVRAGDFQADSGHRYGLAHVQVYDDQLAWVGSESAHIHLQRRQDEEDVVVDAWLLHVMCLLLRHLAKFVEVLQDCHGR